MSSRSASGLDLVGTRSRLIKQEIARVGRQGAGNLQAAAGAVGQRLGAPVRELGQAELLEHRPGRTAERCTSRPIRMEGGPDFHVLKHRQLLEQSDVLEGSGNAQGRDLVGRSVCDVATVEPDRSTRRDQHAGEHVEQGRLAGTVGADEADDLPGSQLTSTAFSAWSPLKCMSIAVATSARCAARG